MMQALLLVGLAVEFTIYFLLGMYWWRQGLHPGLIPLLILIMSVGLRIAAALPTYLLCSAFRRCDRARLPWGNSLLALAGEIDARAFALTIAEPFHPWLMATEPLGPRTAMPILLVHGYVANRGIFWRLQRRIAAAGLGPVYTVSLRPLFGSIDEMIPVLAVRIEAICAETTAEKIIIVAHSMGGLVTRAYLAAHAQNNPGHARVARLVTIASPHQGTQMANFSFGPGVQQMRPGSVRLQALAAAEAGLPKPPTLSIYTLNDDIVYPAESSRLAWAENLPMTGVGHVGLLNSKSVGAKICSEIQKHSESGKA